LKIQVWILKNQGQPLTEEEQELAAKLWKEELEKERNEKGTKSSNKDRQYFQ
jgi:hypothetical protein